MLKTFFSKETALWLSLALGFFIPAVFAWDIYTTPEITPNVATWILVFVMDVVGLWIAYAEGNKRPFMQIGWVLAAACIVMAILFRQQGTWHWGIIETVSSVLCVLAIVLWRTLSSKAAIIGLTLQSAAVYASFLPQAVDYWNKPEPSTWYLWFWSAVACGFAIYASQKRDAAHTLIPWAAIVLNVGILFLVIR